MIKPWTVLLLAVTGIESMPAQETVPDLGAMLQEDPFDEAVLDRLAAGDAAVVPLVIELLKLPDDRMRLVALPFESTKLRVRVPIAKIRALEVLRRKGGAAKAALLDLVDLLEQVQPDYFGNVLDTLTHMVPRCTLSAVERGQIRRLDLDAVLVRRKGKFARDALRVVVRRGDEYVVVRAHPSMWTRFLAASRLSARLLATTPLPKRIQHHDLFLAEMACYRAELIPAHRKDPAVVKAVLDRLAAFYPDDQSTEASMRRDMAGKTNPGFLDALARAAVVLAPDRAVHAHVHFMQAGPLATRRAAILAIRRLGEKGAPATPWLLSVAKYGRRELATEAFVTLGMQGALARSTLPDLRRLARGRDRFRSSLARAALQQIAK